MEEPLPNRGLFRKIRGALLATFFGLIVSVALLEGALRIHNPIHVPLRANDIVLPVNSRFFYKDPYREGEDAIVYNSYNRLGFRGAEPPKDFDAHRTVLTVGGSTTACVGLTDGKTWPDFLTRKLSGSVPKLWINNAGMDGHSTFGHLHLLRQVLRAMHPDFIVYLVGVNDVGRKDLNDWDRGIRTDSQSVRDAIVRRSELLSTIQVLSRTYRAFDIGLIGAPLIDLKKIKNVGIDEARFAKSSAEHRATHVPAYRTRVKQLIEDTRSAGIEPILMTQPALYGDGIDPSSGQEIGPLEFHDGESASSAWRILELYNDVVRDLGRASGVTVIDLAAELPKDSALYTDWIHYSERGAERVADIVARVLEPILLENDRRPLAGTSAARERRSSP